MASLFVIQGADQGKRFEFRSGPVALGRDNSNAIRLHDTEVSRRHAELRQDDDTYRVVDLGSANGTYVNGQLIDQAPLRSPRARPPTQAEQGLRTRIPRRAGRTREERGWIHNGDPGADTRQGRG